MSTITWGELKGIAQDILWESIDYSQYKCDYIYDHIYYYYDNEGDWTDEERIENQTLEWIEEGWEILSKAQLTNYRTEIEHGEVLITFLALIIIYLENISDSSEDSYLLWAEHLNIKANQVRKIFTNIYDIDLDINKSQTGLDENQLQYLLKDARRQVIAVLTEEFGSELGVYGSIWQSIQPEIRDYEEYQEYEEYNFYRNEVEITYADYLAESCLDWIETYQENDEEEEKQENLDTIETNIDDLFFIENLNIDLSKRDKAAILVWQLERLFEGEVIVVDDAINNYRTFYTTQMTSKINPQCPFSIQTFKLFEKLSIISYDSFVDEDNFLVFSQAYKEFKKNIEEPFQELCFKVSNQMADNVTNSLERKEGCFNGVIPLNESKEYVYNPFCLEHVFCLKAKENKDYTRLFISLDSESLKFGLRLEKNSIKHLMGKCLNENYKEILSRLGDDWCYQDINFTGKPELTKSEFSSFLEYHWWFQFDKYDEIYATFCMKADEVLQCSAEELTRQVTYIFEHLFPLVLLVTSDNPMPAICDYLNLPQLKYTLTQCAEDTSREESQLQRWIRTIERKKQAILYGSPGTGKTFIAEKLAQYLISSSNGFSELIQFHPAYSYEDFIQGIRPQSQNEQLTYPLVPGRFIEFCKKAESYPGLCVLIIDEINRANLAQVFGELMYLLEYRDKKIPLAGSSEPFGIPQNVRIIGTMNTADRSIALVDHALRRRFAFIELCPNYQVLRQYHQKITSLQVEGLIEKLQQINQAIADKHYELGISFFLTENLAEQIDDIWQMEIEPYLEEYFFDQLDKVDEFRWEKVQSQICPLHENNPAN